MNAVYDGHKYHALKFKIYIKIYNRDIKKVAQYKLKKKAETYVSSELSGT